MRKKRAPYRNKRKWISDGKYPSMTVLCFILLDKNPLIEFEEMRKEVIKHFPNAEFNLDRFHWMCSAKRRGVVPAKWRLITKGVKHGKAKKETGTRKTKRVQERKAG